MSTLNLDITQWFCARCVQASLNSPAPLRTVFKPPPRKSQRSTLTKLDYANLEANLPADPNRWLRVIETREVIEDAFQSIAVDDITDEWLWSEKSFIEPFLIERPEGLGMKMPDPEISIHQIAQEVGELGRESDSVLSAELARPVVFYRPSDAHRGHWYTRNEPRVPTQELTRVLTQTSPLSPHYHIGPYSNGQTTTWTRVATRSATSSRSKFQSRLSASKSSHPSLCGERRHRATKCVPAADHWLHCKENSTGSTQSGRARSKARTSTLAFKSTA